MTDDSLSNQRGTILVDHGSRRAESNLMLEQLARSWQGRRPELIVEPAHMELAAPSISDAFDACVRRGATRVVVSPFFLLPGRHWTDDIPTLVAEAAQRHPDVPWLLAAPLGVDDRILNLLEQRIETCVQHARWTSTSVERPRPGRPTD